MKPLVVYYSLEGNTRCIAEAIAGEVGGELLELKPVADIKPKGLMRFFWGGKQVMTGEKPELQPYSINPADYDPIFIGSPVWAASYAPALKTFFASTPLHGKTIGLFCCYQGSPGKTFARMRQALEGNTIAGDMSFRDPLKHDTNNCRREAAKWVASW